MRLCFHAVCRAGIARTIRSLAFLGALAANSPAQVVNDGAINTLDNVTTNVAGDVTVGTNGSFTLLILTNGALLTNSGHGVIGRNTNANSNTVWLTGMNTRWLMSSNMIVGSNGAFNRLVISNGALVGNHLGQIGFGTSSSNNTVVVTGAGSFWSNRSELHIGESGGGNSLEISDGARVRNTSAWIGYLSSNNQVLVAGSNSLWSNLGGLLVGSFTAGNRLVISNGGQVWSSSSILGNSTGGTNNQVTVTGAGSFWDNQLSLWIGNNGNASRLVVEAGGLVGSDEGRLGVTSARQNEAVVTGTGSVWSNRLDLFVGSSTASNRLVVSNGGWILNSNGVVGLSSGGSNNETVVTGAGSFWSNRVDVTVGSSGSRNLLIVSNGALVGNNTGYIGRNTGSASNQVTVSGTGSHWSNRQDVYVGFNGGGSRLVVENGGLVGDQIGYIGQFAGSGNEALVTGAGSVWSNRDSFNIGSQSAGNRLVVSNGGQVLAGANGVIGSTSSGSSNLVLVTGAGSMWSNQLDLFVGGLGSNNVLIVSNGGLLVNSNAWFGASGGINNKVVVTDTGSLWSNRGEVYLGRLGFNSQLVVSDGGTAFTAGDAFVGHSVDSSFVLLTDPGSRWTGGLISDLYIGSNAAFNRLVISNGAVADHWRLVEIGQTAVGDNNELVVTGAGSLLSHSLGLIVGRNGSANRLVVSNGGTATSASGFIGHTINGVNNEVIVTGAGSLWSNAFELYVGSLGSGNRLTITNGGSVLAAGTAYVGATATSTNNRLIVDGGTLQVTNTNGLGSLHVINGTNVLNAGLIDVDQLVVTNTFVTTDNRFLFNGGTLITRGANIINNLQFVVGNSGTTPAIWDVRAGVNGTFIQGSNFVVGSNSSFNQMLITNGGGLTNFSTFTSVGVTSAAKSNTVTLAGVGSRWANGGFLAIGVTGSVNRVVVSNGAVLGGGIGPMTIGAETAASGNEVIVTGTGSSLGLALFNDLVVGSNGSNNRLIVSNGGFVTNQTGHIGAATNGNGNMATVTGTGSIWSNRLDLVVGEFGGVSQLVVKDGGLAVARHGVIGRGALGTFQGYNNTAVVTDSGSRWLLQSNLYVGSNGPFNLLIVGNGGFVGDSTGFVGFNATNGLSQAWVTGPGSVWSNGANLFVGFSNGSGHRLVVSNGGTVSSAGEVIVGLNFAASSNTAVVTDSGSLLLSAGNLAVGGSSSFNRLVISNGAVVSNLTGIIGPSSNANNNEVIVTGAGSRWVASTNLFLGIKVGSNGSGNRLVISDGAQVLAGDSKVGAPVLFGSNNSAFVTGPGSFWSNKFDLDLNQGSLLVISNGGMVRDSAGRIGAGGDDNVAIVTGTGSSWSNIGSLGVGVVGLRNRLIVSNGGLVYAGQIPVGPNINSIATRLVVDGGTLVATNFFGTGTGFLNVHRGTNVLNSGLIDVDQLVMTNTLGKFEFNGGTLVTRGAYLSNGAPVVVGTSGAGTAVWDVRAGVSNHFLFGNLILGDNSSFNQLLVTNGALLTNAGIGSVGFLGTSHSNAAVIGGTGSRWHMRDEFDVGSSGSGNRLVISNGGGVMSLYGEVGLLTSANNNDVVVTGAGSIWSTREDLYFGVSGSGNRLVVTGGGMVANSNGFIGYSTNSSNNSVFVAGTGSLWTNSGELYVGLDGRANLLIVSNGGTVFTEFNRNVGGNSGANSNTVLVTDAGSGWLGPDSLYVGSGGAFNRLIVSNGGRVTSGIGTIGGLAGANSNLVLVTDAGSVWSNQFDLTVGENGSANRLVVSNGGTIFTTSGGYIGRNSGANSNTVTVTGAGSVWTNASDVNVGYAGSGNQLVVSNGGMVQNNVGYVGFGINSSNNVAVVTGSGSAWSNRAELNVGFLGPGNQLIVGNGGLVRNGYGVVGVATGSSNNAVVVAGLGSLWSNADELHVGLSGPGSRLVVSNGGTVFASNSVLVGESSNSLNNRIVVDGGTLRAANVANTGVIEVRRGTNVLNAGLIEADRLLLNNALGAFEFNGGTLVTKNTTHSNGRLFTVGNGTGAATFQLLGGTHAFSNNLVISSNATLAGNGLIIGTVTNFGTISPGASAGKLRINGDLRFLPFAGVTFELGGPLASNQYDQVVVTNFVQFAGTLSLSLINNFLPDDSDTFMLVSFSSSSGSFTNALNGSRVNLTNNLASFAVTYTPTNFVLGGVQYVDGDGDGQPDLFEQAAGTDAADPRNALAIISITETNGGAQVLVDFQSVPGKNYRVEHTTNLASGVWTPIFSPPLNALATNRSRFTDDGSLTGGIPVTRRFYRIGLQ